MNPGKVAWFRRSASYLRGFGFSLFQSQSSKSLGSSPRRALSIIVLHFMEIPYSACFEGSRARAPCSVTSMLSLPRAVSHPNTALSAKIRPLVKSLLAITI